MAGLNCYVVSYDIREQKRLYKVHRAMMGFGEPVHYSVFRCLLTSRGKEEMMEDLTDLIIVNRKTYYLIDIFK
ncbi:MAG: CRISPR-associated endonuclease Cas2 [Methanothrix sp.]|nr:CRISPR-associated endonuclease Cas2 [Methanothrix sp.]